MGVVIEISIHAPREGSDLITMFVVLDMTISIHAPREGSDECLPRPGREQKHFYPRSPRGERPKVFSKKSCVFKISIHAPREGSDRAWVEAGHCTFVISIHAPREGSDTARPTPSSATSNFYPRSPRGERHLNGIPVDRTIVISIHAPREGSDPHKAKRLRPI